MLYSKIAAWSSRSSLGWHAVTDIAYPTTGGDCSCETATNDCSSEVATNDCSSEAATNGDPPRTGRSILYSKTLKLINTLVWFAKTTNPKTANPKRTNNTGSARRN